MFSRRTLLLGLFGLVSSGGFVGACRDHREGARTAAGSEASSRRFLSIVCDLVLPETADGPAASSVGVPEFVLLGLRRGLEDTLSSNNPHRPADGNFLAWLEQALDTRAGGYFAQADQQMQLASLSQIDEVAFSSRDAVSPWKPIKALILVGYYTSEAGGSDVLRYEPVPGRYDGRVLKDPGMKTFSNDWTALRFG